MAAAVFEFCVSSRVNQKDPLSVILFFWLCFIQLAGDDFEAIEICNSSGTTNEFDGHNDEDIAAWEAIMQQHCEQSTLQAIFHTVTCQDLQGYKKYLQY